ncbi:hypothetical protein Enr13x_10130 [Stieleria neptunia]|uniref:Uncharacterized protein n=1 Tax=Stieleria neptunia TaxID=2527979 RepID=A0A518HJZ7_9BACT|nr:hypothetical protein [Stieleria neptunia]QDV41175.1 hypothetical protein Enr13x_10130 [Stieleria neptunia]
MTGPQSAENNRPSKILLEELFADQDDRFLEVFVQFDSYEMLKHFTIKWLDDSRQWAKDQLIEYLRGPLDHPGHEVVVKRVLKTALERSEIGLIVHLTVAMDGLVRRKRMPGYSYDYRTRQYQRREYLFAKPNRTVREVTGRYQEYTRRRRTYRVPLPDIRNKPGHRLFSQRTRAYVRRRVWRNFRVMAHRDPERYVESVCKVLALYDDSFFDTGEAILDNWSLMHACYFHAKEISFTASHTNLAVGEALATLAAAPYRPEVWTDDDSASRLWTLLAEARSQFVRMWTIEMLQTQHSQWLSRLGVEELLRMLSSSDATVAEFAADLFRNHASLSSVEVSTWLRLLDQADFSVLPTICEAMQRHIAPARLSDDQLIELTMATPAAIARLGFDWLQQRHDERPLSSESLVRLAKAKCEWEAETIAAWAITNIAASGSHSADQITEFFDSRSNAVRNAACNWLTAQAKDGFAGQRLQDDPALWVKLTETPYDQVRFALVETLRGVLSRSPKRYLESLSVEQQLRVLAAVVLCVDRGSRSKPKAIEQLTSLAISSGQHASTVVSVLAIAARSVRGPERAAGLSALARLVAHSGDLESIVADRMTEWDWSPEAVTGDGQKGVAT